MLTDVDSTRHKHTPGAVIYVAVYPSRFRATSTAFPLTDCQDPAERALIVARVCSCLSLPPPSDVAHVLPSFPPRRYCLPAYARYLRWHLSTRRRCRLRPTRCDRHGRRSRTDGC